MLDLRDRLSAAMLVIAGVGLMLAAGVALGWYWFRPAPIVETAKPAEVQADGSTVLPRAPNPQAKPKHKTPKGAKVERTGQIVAQPTTPPEILACPGAPTCPPVTIDTSLVRLPDGSRRVVVSSPDGQVLKGVDIPVETAQPPPDPPRWAIGLSVDPVHQTPGLWVERDLWRARVGLDLNQTRQRVGGPTASEIRVRVGWTF